MREKSEVDRRLDLAVRLNLDPAKVSPERRWFAWYPVWGLDYALKCRRWLWLETVTCFCPLGLIWEYYTIEGE